MKGLLCSFSGSNHSISSMGIKFYKPSIAICWISGFSLDLQATGPGVLTECLQESIEVEYSVRVH